MLYACTGICVLSSVHDCEMKGSLVPRLIVKYSSILFQLSQSIRLDALVVEFGGGGRIFFKTLFLFLESSIELIIVSGIQQ